MTPHNPFYTPSILHKLVEEFMLCFPQPWEVKSLFSYSIILFLFLDKLMLKNSLIQAPYY